MTAALTTLPLARWATRFARGSAVLLGRLDDEHLLDLDGSTVVLDVGPVHLDVAFAGGPTPQLTAVHVQGVAYRVGPGAGPALEGLLHALFDPCVDVTASTDEALRVKVGHGIEAHVPRGGTVRLRASSLGPPDRPRLARSLRVEVDGAGIRLGHDGARWLSALARVRIRRAALHPDGSVHLEGGARTGIDRVVRSGLRRASSRLSTLVRGSPRFASVRAFLAHP